ncbi:MAG: ATP-dependent DNA helicase RecG [Clostridia bacterium]|nr:ATP-dependent DNA helicase RecG [Clostridia bacterium]
MRSTDNVRYVKGVGEKRAELFRQLGIESVGALLRHYPRSYIDRSRPLKLREAPFDRPCCIKAKVFSEVREIYVRHKMVLYKFFANDGEENVEITLFNQKWAAEKLEFGKEFLFYGQVNRTLFSCEMSSPEIYDSTEQTISPVYPQTAGLNSKAISKAIQNALSQFVPDDPLPETLRQKYSLISLKEALFGIHFPKTFRDVEAARKRLVFEELFFLQTGILFQKSSRSNYTPVKISGQFLDEFKTRLPFTLTEAQSNAILQCLNDMQSGRPMSRLVQGDVGSGKTAVAVALSYCAAKENWQSVIMAPTEVLATQHFETFRNLLKNSGINVALLTGSVTKAKKAKIKEAVLNGEYDIVIGTHAVLQDDVCFKRLGLIVTDEQHRFGVEQRTSLTAKGNEPHMLVMSATPIPRTMSLIFYGDLDISIIDSLPRGRQPIATYLIDSSIRQRSYNYIRNHLDQGRQGYIVCPMVEENETADLASAVKYYEDIKENDFKNYTVGLLHGKMKPKEKDAVMKAFASGEIQLLVSTTVIEVGIDVPNAVIMLIENAERFGLSQLHQLRGRIGRGQYASTCILLSDRGGNDTKQRLKFMCSTTDGFKVADKDLELRGPGDFLGKRQHGLPELKIADLSEDMELFRAAGNAAKELYRTDPTLKSPENQCLRTEISTLFKTAKTYGYN